MVLYMKKRLTHFFPKWTKVHGCCDPFNLVMDMAIPSVYVVLKVSSNII